MDSGSQEFHEGEEDPEEHNAPHHEGNPEMQKKPEIKTMHASCVHGDTQEPSSRFEMEGDLIDLDD